GAVGLRTSRESSRLVRGRKWRTWLSPRFHVGSVSQSAQAPGGSADGVAVVAEERRYSGRRLARSTIRDALWPGVSERWRGDWCSHPIDGCLQCRSRSAHDRSMHWTILQFHGDPRQRRDWNQRARTHHRLWFIGPALGGGWRIVRARRRTNRFYRKPVE